MQLHRGVKLLHLQGVAVAEKFVNERSVRDVGVGQLDHLGRHVLVRRIQESDHVLLAREVRVLLPVHGVGKVDVAVLRCLNRRGVEVFGTPAVLRLHAVGLLLESLRLLH